MFKCCPIFYLNYDIKEVKKKKKHYERDHPNSILQNLALIIQLKQLNYEYTRVNLSLTLIYRNKLSLN